MNIGILIPGFSDGERDWCIPVYLNLVRTLAQSDSVRVFALRYPPRRDSYSVFGAQVHAIGGNYRTAGLGRWLLLLRTIAEVLQQHRLQSFDVLHAIWADETGFAACVAGRLIAVPVVVSLAGGELARLPDYGLQSGRVTRWLVSQALACPDRVIAPCQHAADLAQHTALPALRIARLEVVPLGVDTTLFTPVEGNKKRLLAVGSLTPVKGHDQLLQALTRLPDIGLDIVGEGPLLSRLRDLASSLGVAERVTFHGGVAHDALPRFYQAAVLNILPSRHEAFGMVVVEAAACGLPSVGFALGVLAEIDGVGGIAVPPGDVEALAAAIRHLLDDPARLAACRQAARHLAETRYSLRSMTEGLRDVYCRTIGASGTSSRRDR